ncbi:MAG: [CysO sulfur-carrier protein]-S-L-cysteine hydrolase [Thermoleophilaceae bacterium]|nr:[CysO sulfur-carrier protein]-S-L-cysteine hydrolase [Thermoleophilaceae bacterium]
MRIAPELLEQIVEHARRDAPNECCGLIGVRNGTAVSVHPTENVAASPFRFEIDGRTLFRLTEQLEEEDLMPGAIYHSHTRSDPYPSQTDLNFAALWPDWEWLIVGLAGEEPEIRHFRIESGAVVEEALT